MLDNLQLFPPEAFTSTGSVVEKVIDKVSDAVGWIVKPTANMAYQLEAEKYLIKQIENDPNMPPLAKAAAISKARKLIKEYLNQQKILSIALDFLNDSAKPERVDDDWLKFFFEKVKNVSKEEMAIIWGKILAKEINNSDSVSKSLIYILSIIDYEDAVNFKKIANFCVTIGERCFPVIFYNKFDEIYLECGLRQEDIMSLVDIGLLRTNPSGYSSELGEDGKLIYFDSVLDMNSKSIFLGNVTLSKAGEELMSIVDDGSKVDKLELHLKNMIYRYTHDFHRG